MPNHTGRNNNTKERTDPFKNVKFILENTLTLLNLTYYF